MDYDRLEYQILLDRWGLDQILSNVQKWVCSPFLNYEDTQICGLAHMIMISSYLSILKRQDGMYMDVEEYNCMFVICCMNEI